MEKLLLLPAMIISMATFAQIPTSGLTDRWELNGNLQNSVGATRLITGGIETCFDAGISYTTMRSDTINFVDDRNFMSNRAYRVYLKETNDSFYCSITGSWINPSYLRTFLETSLNYAFQNSSRTVAMWAKNVSRSRQRLFFMGSQTAKSAFGLDLKPDINTVSLFTWGGGNDLDATVANQDSAWHHYVATYNGSFLKLYIDGVIKDSFSISNLNTTTSLIKFGDNFGSANLLIDDILLYNRAITAQEVSDIYLNCAPQQLTATVSGNQLNASISGATSYTWINCATNQPVIGATSQAFTPSASGQYLVKVNVNGCEYTSACVSFTLSPSSVSELANDMFRLYPNPANGNFVIEVDQQATIYVADMMGKVLKEVKSESGKINISTNDMPSGVYLVSVMIKGNVHHKRVIVN